MRLLLLLGCLLASSCGGSSPSAPSNDRVSGVWVGHSTLTSAIGGECVGSTLEAAIGSRDIFAAPIQQSGSDLVAAVTYQGNRTSCAYRGTATGAAVSLTMTSCQVGRIVGFRCSDGSVRDLQVVTARVAASASGRTGTGTDTTTWNVLAPGSATSLDVLTVSAVFTWNALGIPHSDFHIFDGSIVPGYVDGVVTILEEPNPFCTKCGWF